MRLTADDLRKRYACAPQTALFESLFPGGVEVTEALCIEHAMSFDWHWAARNLFPTAQQREYVGAIYRAWDDLRRAKVDARKRCKSDARYRRAVEAAWDRCDRARAAAFGRIAERLDSPFEGRVDSLTDRSVN